MTSPPVALCAAVLVWFASQSYPAAVAVGMALVAVGAWAGRCLNDEAWAFIPRRRQDRGRSLPFAWELASAVLLAGLLAAVLLLVAGRLAQSGVPSPVRAVVFGMGAAAAVAEVASLAYRAVRRRGSAGRAGLLALPWAAAFVGCAVVAYDLLFGPDGPESVTPMAWAGALMLVMAVLAEAARRAGLVR